MKTEKEVRKEIDKILSDKVSARITEFQAQRDEDFKGLVALYQTLEDLEKKRAPFLAERDGLNMLKNADLARRNYLDGHIPWLEKQVKGIQDQIEKITQKLTKVEVDPNILAFLLNFKS